ncbi:GATA transcription factor 18-like [Diospyros lotus]|uniref:GATA transcription factor 18-like n=1 Tax=Diospyros lotus TaxID=55363 RepID=UPI00224EB0FF|nr:GATA transcription factor 18-like [Diospyros lotus]
MHRCSNSQTNSFSMLFNTQPLDEADMYSYSFPSSSSSSVDCTLSLGTPSTRLSGDGDKRSHHDRCPSSCMSGYCWDMLQAKNAPSPPPTHEASRGGNGGTAKSSGANPLLARRCANCDTTSTPLWRNGPRGPKSLCNACGIRFKKEERRATAAAASGAVPGAMEQPQHMINNSWVQHPQSQKLPCFSPAIGGNEFRFIDDADCDGEGGGIPFLSWRINVTDRPSLVHDFTR